MCASSREWGMIVFVEWLPQVTKLPFCAGIELGRCIAQSTVFSLLYDEKTTTWGPFSGFKSKRLSRMNLMYGNTDNISHVPILTWPGITSSLTSHWSVNNIIHHFCLNCFVCVSFVIIWYKNIPLETWMESFNGKPMLWKFALYFNACVLQENSITENISLAISSSQFYQNYYYIRYIKWCKR